MTRPHALADRGALGVLGLVFALFVLPMEALLRFGPHLPFLASPRLSLQVLAASAALSILLAFASILGQLLTVGGPTVRGNREAYPSLTGVTARLARAHASMVEALAPFACAVVASFACGVTSPRAQASAVMFLVARLVHALAYGLGIPVLRSAAYYTGAFATLSIAGNVILMWT